MATDQIPRARGVSKANTTTLPSKSRKSVGKSEEAGAQVAHTLTACVRCRQVNTPPPTETNC